MAPPYKQGTTTSQQPPSQQPRICRIDRAVERASVADTEPDEFEAVLDGDRWRPGLSWRAMDDAHLLGVVVAFAPMRARLPPS